MQVISVEPAAAFGTGHGSLVVEESGEPGRVIVRQADRVIYVPLEWVDLVVRGEVPWAQVVPPRELVLSWMGSALKIQGTDRLVVYKVTGSCGPRVPAWLCEWPD
jgi:hypothetical protein